MSARSQLPDGTRLGALIRLLGSDQDGEVLAAARALARVLEATGSDLHALADAVERLAIAPATSTPSGDWQYVAGRVLAVAGDELSQRERSFLRQMRFWHGAPSGKQLTWLWDIAKRFDMELAA